ncbi:hypothetical protein M408DRAFT_331453 [Serendipita vermifera MAFF 305830]|uniref:SnoaL-like domain-containing protein n=1 Tax=Serendipita vermifera MAFF 305830 TaxID=933852 RepID=A0A0C3B0C1_SERVB|nr:hypothetical protein M408DRAFT_331453 [Serendipita vermifera MAFF 305830]
MSAHSGQELVERYLAAYKAGDLQAMEACMDPEFTFSDPAFPHLDTKHAKGMFAMFINNRDTNKMEVEYTDIKKGTNDLTYTATYTVKYLFAGRPVTNVIRPTFTISPTTNLLLTQVDDFPFYPWARQALGLPGLLLGWSGYLQGKVQQTAGSRLEHSMKKAETTQ